MKKTLMVFGVAGVLTCSMPTISVKATSNIDTSTYTSDEINTRAAGLIYQYDSSFYVSNGVLFLNGRTISKTTMKTIGFDSIKIQRSSNGTSWTTEKTITDLYNSSSKSYYLNDYSVAVTGGYYYRVVCTHYAKESGLFGGSQSETSTSSTIWVS